MDFGLLKEIREGIGKKEWWNGVFVAITLLSILTTFLVFTFNLSPITFEHSSEIINIPLNETFEFPPETNQYTKKHKYSLVFDGYTDGFCINSVTIDTNYGENGGQQIQNNWCKGENKGLNQIELSDFQLKLKEIFVSDNEVKFEISEKTSFPWWCLILLSFILTAILGIILYLVSKPEKTRKNKKSKK